MYDKIYSTKGRDCTKSIYNKVASYYVLRDEMYSMEQKMLFNTYFDALKKYEDFVSVSLTHMDELIEYDKILRENSDVIVKMIDSVNGENFSEVKIIVENECSHIIKIIYSLLLKWGKPKKK